MKMDRRINIYTPAGYEQSGDRKYPVLYLLHGMGGMKMSGQLLDVLHRFSII